MADLGCEFLKRASAQRQRIHELCMPVTLKHLRRNRSRLQAKFFAHISLDGRIQMSIRPHSSRYLSDGHRLPGTVHPSDVSNSFRIPESEFESKSGRLRVDSMRPADHQCVLELFCP